MSFSKKTTMAGIVHIPLSSIIVEDRLRQDMGDLTTLMDSMRVHGLLNPIILGDGNKLLAGGRRFLSAEKLNWPTIPARIVPGLNPSESLTIELIENLAREDFKWYEQCENTLRIHEAFTETASLKGKPWSMRKTIEKIGCSLGSLQKYIETAIMVRAFPQLKTLDSIHRARAEYKELSKIIEAGKIKADMSPEDIAAIENLTNAMGMLSSIEPEPKDSQAPSDPTTPASDNQPLKTWPQASYIIDPYQKVMASMPDNAVALVEIDPPYAINFNEVYGQAQNLNQRSFEDWSIEEFSSAIPSLLVETFRILMPNSWVLFWCPFQHLDFVQSSAEKAGFITQLPGAWVKPGAASNSPMTNMIRVMETFLLFRKGDARFSVPSFRCIVNHNTQPSADRVHVNEKPVGLYLEFLKALGRPGQLLFTPFAGAGNVLLASALSNMQAIGCDISPRYRDNFIIRYQRLATIARAIEGGDE